MLYHKYTQNNRSQTDFAKVQDACKLINDLIVENKNAYYGRLSKKLSNLKTSPKAYWSILKSFFSNKKNPVLLVNDEYISDF